MSRGSDTQPSSTQSRTAFRRRLSERDLLDLQRLTIALKHAGASAFERFGVTVHLVHKPEGLPKRRQADGEPLPAGGGDERQDQPAHEPSARSPRRQRRYERGQQRAMQRTGCNKPSPDPQGRVAEAPPSGEPPGEATTQHVDTASSAAAKATAIAAVTAAPAQPLLQPQQQQQHYSSGESNVLGLAQPLQAVREKRSAPSTPPRVTGEHVHAEDSGSPESVVPVPKRAHASSSSLDPPPSRVGTRNPSPTKELIGIPINNPGVSLLDKHNSDESDLEDSEQLTSDLISESDRPIFAALKAASRGDLSAQSFLMEKYTRGEVSPTMREMMEGMIEDGLKKRTRDLFNTLPPTYTKPPYPP